MLDMYNRVKDFEDKLFLYITGSEEYDLGELEDWIYALHDDDPDTFDIAFYQAIKRAREIAN